MVKRSRPQRVPSDRAEAGARRRFAPHQLCHANAVELAREGVPLNVIQRQLGHANLGTTSIYLQGIDTEEMSPPSTRDSGSASALPLVPVQAGVGPR